MNRHIILVGLPGSGKTAVGRLLLKLPTADFTDFTDIDELVERAAGCSITEIFALGGEAEFRRLEREAMDRALERPAHLIAAGAGWIAQPGNLAAARAGNALTVYLRVTPEVASARLGTDQSRPLLAGDRLTRLKAILAERESWYAQADAKIDASGPPDQVVALLRAAIRRAS